MNSKKRRREEKRLLENSQYALIPESNIDVKLDVLQAMGRDCKRIAEEWKSSDAGGGNKRRGKSKFVLGVNAVTRALERNELDLVVVCGRAKPIFTQHLPLMCARKQCKWHTTGDLSCESMGKYFGVKRLSSFGLMRDETLNKREASAEERYQHTKKRKT